MYVLQFKRYKWVDVKVLNGQTFKVFISPHKRVLLYYSFFIFHLYATVRMQFRK